MKHGHLASGNGGFYIIRSDDGGTTWATIGTAFSIELANEMVQALDEHAAVRALRSDLDAGDRESTAEARVGRPCPVFGPDTVCHMAKCDDGCSKQIPAEAD